MGMGCGKMIMWLVLFQKRLLKKPGFLVLVLLVPCLAAGMRAASLQESSLLRIVLYCREEDEAAGKLVEELLWEESVIHYDLAESEEEARDAVVQGRADAAWMFLEDLQEGLDRAARHGRVEELVTVVQQEDNMQLRLARMKLYAAIYPDAYVYSVYEDFIGNRLSGGEELEEGLLRQYYDAFQVTDQLFCMRYANAEDEVEDVHYLLSPLRGMLALCLVLMGMAMMLYYMEDEQNGVLDRIPLSARFRYALGYSAVAAVDGAVLVLASLELAGVAVGLGRECLGVLLLGIMTVGFCNLLRLLCGSRERLGACLPVLVVGTLVLTVFFDFRQLRFLQYLLPSYYYGKAVHSRAYFGDMAIYAAVANLLAFLVAKREGNH